MINKTPKSLINTDFGIDFICYVTVMDLIWTYIFTLITEKCWIIKNKY